MPVCQPYTCLDHAKFNIATLVVCVLLAVLEGGGVLLAVLEAGGVFSWQCWRVGRFQLGV